MNKKGFTLIELLASITIMALIATIASINFVKIFDNERIIADNNKDTIIAEAACVYIELEKNKDLKNTCLKNGCEISSDTLIKSGLLKEDDVSNSKVIHIYKENNEKKCIIK